MLAVSHCATFSLRFELRIDPSVELLFVTIQIRIHFASIDQMTRRMHFTISAKIVRDTLDEAVQVADKIHEKESNLILLLHQIDQERFYVRYGYKSLLGFCRSGLKFTKAQSLRLATAARRVNDPKNILNTIPEPGVSNYNP